MPAFRTRASAATVIPSPRHRSFIRPLDRYVFTEFWKIFVAFALGFPILVIIIDLTDNLQKYLSRNLPRADVALSYLYWLPDSMFLVLPAAVLFATVFSIGGFTRHSEITAAKASGISFYRLILPVYAGAVLAALFGLALGEVVPITNAKRLELLQENKYKQGTERYNFAYAAEQGRVYKIGALSVERGTMESLELERKGKGADYPSYVLSASQARYNPKGHTWTVGKGTLHVIPDSGADVAFAFDSLRDRQMHEQPSDLMAVPRSPQEMGYRDLTRFIRALERSGGDANELKVERALKIAIPVTCLVIALFGAPLATSTQRGGSAYGVGVSLGTTVIFLMLIQLTKAIGGKGLIPPDLAAWIPNFVFAVVGTWLLTRVRT
jgi:lipopolysaccharide export system permease protein